MGKNDKQLRAKVKEARRQELEAIHGAIINLKEAVGGTLFLTEAECADLYPWKAFNWRLLEEAQDDAAARDT